MGHRNGSDRPLIVFAVVSLILAVAALAIAGPHGTVEERKRSHEKSQWVSYIVNDGQAP